MKKIIIIIGLILLGTQALWSTITVDGFCYLDGETNHSGTKILFEAVTPSAITDSTYTNADGSFLIGLSGGIYTITYSHDSRLSYTIPGGVEIFINTTLDPVTLYIGLSGALSGTLVGGYSYHVAGDISVNSGDTLIIEPSVTVEFMDCYSFSISGKLIAAGTETDTIRFTSGQSIANPNDWNYIIFESDSDSNSVISYTKIEYAKYGIYCYSSSPTISNNTINSNNYSYGIFCYSSSPTISNNTISNSHTGIYCYSSSSPSISNNTISNNYSNGIHCGNSSSPTISNNTICKNNDDGISITSSISHPNILNNIIYDNNDYGVTFGGLPSAFEYNIFWLNLNVCSGSAIPPYFGQIITVNANGDSCDTYCNLFMDPLFVDPLNGDYHLSWVSYPIPDSTKSPCIDAGDPSSPPDPDGTIADMGAFYFNQNISIDEPVQPSEFNLTNYPNPISSNINNLTVSFNIHKPGRVTIQIFNIKGQLVSTLINEDKNVGEYTIAYQVNELSSGIYFTKMNVDGVGKEVKKVILLR